jgi:hypothetical protein
MSFNLEKILESKRAFRRDLAARPIAEKLLMLDALRERELAIRGHASHSTPAPAVRKEPDCIAPGPDHLLRKASPEGTTCRDKNDRRN